MPGGILASYKKRAGLTPQEVMEQGFWDKMRDFTDKAADYFDVVGKSERDMMAQTKNYTNRLRLQRQVDFNEDFRKRFMTREYGNYQKYDEQHNAVALEQEKGADDLGYDKLMKNDREVRKRLATAEGEQLREQEANTIESILSNEQNADQTIRERLEAMKTVTDYPAEIQNRDNEMKMVRNFDTQEIQYHGRMSPIAKEELFQNYLKGMTVKDLSLKYGIIPQRVKAIVFQRHLYWEEVYPKLGETHMRMALERELLYAQDFPFIDYGCDLRIMSEMEKGVQMAKIRRSDIDANPPESVKRKIEESLAKMKAKKQDFIPEDFTGKGGKGYILKNWVIHRGYGAPIVSKRFRDVVRLSGSSREHQLARRLKLRMQTGGPRYAAMGAR